MISSMGETWAVVRRLDGSEARISSDEYGLDFTTCESGHKDVANIRMAPSDVKLLHEFFGKALEKWDKTEL